MVKYNEYNGKNILVTGGAGCIGSNLCNRLSDLNADKVIILDNLSSSYEWNIPQENNINFIRGDILDDELLKRVFKEKPDFVFHLAAHFANQNSVDNPEIDLITPEFLTNEEFSFLRRTEQETKLTLSQPLFNSQIFYNIKIRRELSSAEQKKVEVSTRQLVDDIRKAYFTYL